MQFLIENTLKEAKKITQVLIFMAVCICNLQAQNELLKDVLEDYLIYYNTSKEEKIKQYEAWNKTLEHIDVIMMEPTTNEEMLRNSKIDQKEIMNEMKRIKSEIDKLN